MSAHRALVERLLFPLDRIRSGDRRELAYMREFERTQFLGRDDLEALRVERLRTLLAHAEARCPFYAERFAEHGVRAADVRSTDDLARFPILDKARIQSERDRMVADGWPADDLIANQTGGSTGSPISFYLSRDRAWSRAAATRRHDRWSGWRVGHKVACLWGASQDAPPHGRALARLRNVLIDRQLFLDAGSITEERLEQFARRLDSYAPDIVLAYARVATLVARFLDARGGLRRSPRAVVTSAETLEPEDRALVERVFGAPVFNRYGCREVSVIASECDRHDGLHVMAEGLIVEVVGEGGPARPGETGAILVTDLLNHAMPLIRYRIGDAGSLAAGDCDCGRSLPRLERVAGRVTDFLVGDGGRLVSGVFLATYVVANRPSLGQVQIVQHADRRIVFRIVPPAGEPSTADLAYLRESVAKHLGCDVPVEFETVASLEPERSGKFLFSRSEAAATMF